MPRTLHDTETPETRSLTGQRALALLFDRPTGTPPSCELFRLADTLGIRVDGWEVLARPRPRASTLVGSGRLAALVERVGAASPVAKKAPEDADDRDDPVDPAAPIAAPRFDLVLVDTHLGPRQQAQLEDAFGVPVLDRTNVILHIFESRAQTREARLEVELARLRYSLPRVRQTREADDDKQGGGGRGARGHTNVQLEKMRIRARIQGLTREIEAAQRQGDTERRRRSEVWTVALVGYTNAGKSTLMRRLTQADVLAEDKLFATLGTTVRRLHPPATPSILVCDTVGFIRQLPHELVASFHSTLDQAHQADLRLLVVDASDPEWREQLDCVRETLGESAGGPTDDGTPIPPGDERVVFNKVDQLDDAFRAALAEEFPDAWFVSALDPASVQALHARLVEARAGGLDEVELHVPWRRAELLRAIRAQAHIADETHDEAGTRVRVRGLPGDLARWQRDLGVRV